MKNKNRLRRTSGGPRLSLCARTTWTLLATFCASAAVAHEDEPEEVTVYGRAEQQIGLSTSASEGKVGYQDFEMPPLLRVGELVEVIPGMVATQHSGTGKANQYFLRGFNLDHGTDFSAHVDGVPVNMRTHGHGQGYLDLNFIIPELVETAEYRKGPYHAEVGDFSSAGSVDFSYYRRLPQTVVEGTLGQFGFGRGVIAGSFDVGDGTLTGALDTTFYDGPWEIDENLEQYKAYLGYDFELAGRPARVSLQGYRGDWDSTDQIPRRAVTSGLIDDLGFIDPDLGGSTRRYALTGEMDLDHWEVGAYVTHYDFALFSNFTYLLDDPVSGDEFEQVDKRNMFGAWARGAEVTTWSGKDVTWRYGAELRFDDIDEVALYRTAQRRRLATTRLDAVDELSLGIYGEVEVAITERLRGTAGLRGDHYDWDVTALRPVNSGSGDDQILSPKINVAYLVNNGLEAYASWGRGFHSNDVRGATIAIDPASGDPTDTVPVLARSDGAEIGVRFERGETFNAAVVGFWLELDSELVYVGDAGTTEANDGTRRVGVELNTFWQASDWLALNAAYTYTDAAFKENQGGGDRIPGAVRDTLVVGANASWDNGISASAKLRYLGEAALVEDNSTTSNDSLLVNAGAAYRRGPVEYRIDVFNLFDSNDDDIAYFYGSRLAGEGAGIEDVHFHPLEPRSIRASFTYLLEL